MKGDVARARVSGGGIRLSPRRKGSQLVIEGRIILRTTCNHALSVYETIKDNRGRDMTVSYARACVLRHTRWNSRKGQVHKDGTGREWE